MGVITLITRIIPIANADHKKNGLPESNPFIFV